MAGLTAAEEAELRALEAEMATWDDDAGHEVVEKVDSARLKPKKTEGFSLWRSGVGAVRDAGQGILDFVEDSGDALQRKVPLPVLRFGGDADNGIVDVLFGDEATEFTNRTKNVPTLPTLAGEENAGTAERIVRGIGSYLVPFVGWSKVYGVTRGASWLGRSGRAMLAGGTVDLMQDPRESNLATTIRDTFGIDSDTLDALAYEEDEGRLYNRFKAAAVNAPVGLVADSLFEGGFRLIKMYRSWKGSFEEAHAAVRAVESTIPARAPVAAEEVAEAASRGADEAAAGSSRTSDESMRTSRPAEEQPDDLDILDFLREKSGLNEDAFDEEMFSRFAANLVNGNPEHALAKMGIDPSKLDYSKFDNPDLLARMQKGLAEVYEGIAGRLGRTGHRVTEEAVHMAARTMGVTADALRDLYGNTANLAETMMAARLFVGGHAAKLVSQAETALAAIKAGDGTAEWREFLESFYRHAYFLGALRGAGSEVARALQSLKHTTRVGSSTAKGDLKETLKREASAQDDATARADQALQALLEMDSPAEQLLLLSQVMERSGDIGELSVLTRAHTGSTLRRLDGATKETLGNLFSQATGIMNAKSGLAMLGLRSLAKGIGSLTRFALLSPFSRRQAIQARIGLMETWAYVDGVLGGFRAAVGNTIALLEKEGMAEIALNADNLGLREIARRAAALSAEGGRNVRGDFERVDINSRDRAFALSPADRRALNEAIEGTDLPSLLQGSMKFLVRTVGGAINAAGSAARAGTILWINAPDQLLGTLAMRAGAQAEAVRIAARQAAEARLEGPELSRFLKAKVVQLTSEIPDGFDPNDSFLAGQREVARLAGEVEAKEILFQDALEFRATRAMAQGHINLPFAHVIIPFLRTPLRILERTVIDYTPLGLIKDRSRRAFVEGGAARDEMLARVGLGTLMMTLAYQLAEDRTIVGADGKYGGSARVAGRPSYSLVIGGDTYEFLRDDPLGTLLGYGADMRAYIEDQQYDPEATEGFSQMVEAGIWSIFPNIMSKTWLEGLRNLTELAGVGNDDEWRTRLEKYRNSFANRIVPASGTQRGAERIYDPFVREAQSFQEALMKASIGANTLPIKRDHLLGRPVEYMESERLAGIRYGPVPRLTEGDPLMQELEFLSFNIPAAKKTLKGVRMNSAQFNRWLELRGQEVRSDLGLTLEESLRELVQLPEYQQLNRHARIEAVSEEMEGFAKRATEALIAEDKDFATAVLRAEVYDQGKLAGSSREEMDRQTREFAEQLGLMQ